VPPATAKTFTDRMRGRLDVAKVELVQRRLPSLIPNDPKYPAQASYLNAVTAPAAWSVRRGDSRVRIAVVDTGVDVNHPDLRGRVVGTYNAVTRGSSVTDAMGHGTFVAGVAAAKGNNGIGIAGASMGASILAVKVANSANEIWSDAVANGIVWAADHGARVINLSLGSESTSQVESDAIAYATRKGVMVVAAAGNNASTNRFYPAAYPHVVAVGATDAAGKRAWFSQHGAWVTVAAPGVNITGTTPTRGSSFFASTSGYSVGDGTSFSSPIVAAEAALLWSMRPSGSLADIRLAIVRSSHGYANLGLGTGQVDFRAALAALCPSTVPTLTKPTNGAVLAGVMRLSARSTARKVRFLINGASVGAPVATSAGTASTTWPSWGVGNGPRTVKAVDCNIYNLCNARGAQVSVTLANAAPALTSPQASQTLSGSATLTATSTGGGIAFLIDGVKRGFDPAAPYALTYPISSLIDGPHTVRALSCSANGARCTGPMSPSVSFTADSLHPMITAVSSSRFSPNGDGRKDTTRATYRLPDTENVRFQVRNAARTIVRGPLVLGSALTAGTHTFTWDGRLNTHARAGNGTYTLELATSNDTRFGSTVAHVRVEVTAPTLWSITGSQKTFYPYPDSYKDNFASTFTLNKKATITMTVRAGGGRWIRSVVGTRVAGATSILWNGRNNAGARVAAGTYYWTLTAQDVVGNRRAFARYSVVVNGRHLVTKTATLSMRGSWYYLAGGNDSSCAGASRTASQFAPNGVWLANSCSSSLGPKVAASIYRFTLPAAYSYSSLRVAAYGHSLWAPSTLGAGFTRWGTGTYTFTPEITVGRTNAGRTIGTVAATGLVRSRQVEATLYVPNDYPSASDYDVGRVGLVVTYRVFA
jgi:subtilisin family serine protease/flagellar hook assembly protein FlgD